MPSAYVIKRKTSNGEKRWHVRYRLGGRESSVRHGGSFRTEREARVRRDWIAGELAAMRVPDLHLIEPAPRETLRIIAERWRASRVDVAPLTRRNHAVDLARVLPILGDDDPATITTARIRETVAAMHAKGLKRETIRKTIKTLAMVLEDAGVTPNPARDKAVRLPYEDPIVVCPPTAAHVEAVIWLLPSAYRLPTLVKDATGMRVGEIEALTWGDVDETKARWRVIPAVAKTRYGRWVPVDPVVFAAVVATVPREDRDLSARVFAAFGADRYRTALARACKAAGVPVFSPNDLRHRRATLWHLKGVAVAEAAAWLGHSPHEHLKTYAHATLVDRSELDYAALLSRHHRDTTGRVSAQAMERATRGFKPSRRSRAVA